MPQSKAINPTRLPLPWSSGKVFRIRRYPSTSSLEEYKSLKFSPYKRYLPSKPIAGAEFYDALHSIWKPVARAYGDKKPTIGIAVSGGLDSMALARLCQDLTTSNESNRNTEASFHAFVVNHWARPDSDREALLVQDQLRTWGMNCEILNLKWPGEALPQQLSNFETAARRLRYQALGIACRKRGIRSILMAHHNDDQTETVLLRISQGHRGIGLLGIQPVAEIPECWGIHGVHQSEVDEADLIISKRSAGRRNLAEYFSKRRNSEVAAGSPINGSEMLSKNEEAKNTLDIPHHGLEKKESPPLDLESGGMKIYRPLLGFSKDRLKVTCMTLGVEWIEDETNRDPTLTSRNAIRHVLESGKLSSKLQKRSILTLRKRIQLKHQARMEDAEKVFQGCDIMLLDSRSGVLVIRFPSRIRIPELAPAQEEDATNVQYRAALLLQRVANLVTPMEHVSLQSLEFAVDCVFPDVADASANNVDKAMKGYKFTVAGVSFERIDSLLLPTSDENPSHDLDRDFIWVLTRQPYQSCGKLPAIPIGPGPTVPWGLVSTTRPIRPVWAPRNRFQLWDGRFWLRIENPLPTPLVIRPFHLTDLTFLRASLPKPELDDLHARLRAVAPGKVRWTLPVIAELEDDGTTRGGKGWDEEGVRAEGRVQGGEKKTERVKGQVLALPTLGWGPMAKAKGVRWEVRYKKADLGAGRDMSVVT